MQREDVVRRALPLIDLTSLNDDDTPEQIAVLCEQALAAGVAAVCVRPNVGFMAQLLDGGISGGVSRRVR